MDEDDEKRCVSMESSKAGTKKKVHVQSLHNQKKILTNIICQNLIKIIERFNEIQLTKNKMNLNNRKNRLDSKTPRAKNQHS